MKSPLVKFLGSRIFWKNVLLALLITIGLVIIVQISLFFYTGHGKKIRVPDFTGMTLIQVDRICAQNHIMWQSQDSSYIKELPRGTVLDQFPAPGAFIKKNRKIFLVTNCWSPEIIQMPKAFDMPYRQAERILQTAGLKVEKTEFVPYFAPTYVIEQKYLGRTIAEGSPIEVGSGITLVIGRGLSNERAPVPNLLNISKETARLIAMSQYFYLGGVSYDSTVTNAEDSANAKVFRQYPNVNNSARLGTSVDIWLTIDSLRLLQTDSLYVQEDSLSEETTYDQN
jgi:beta-lactam-binding protein with PASTA domain